MAQNNGGQMVSEQTISSLGEFGFSRSQVQLLKSSVLDDKATDDELLFFGLVCQRTGLDPFAKQIYGVRRYSGGKEKIIIQVGIDGLRKIADCTGLYAGNDEALFDEGLTLYKHLESQRGFPRCASVTVWKLVQGIRCPFSASASWASYYPGDGRAGNLWRKFPHLMLGKAAEALALRKAFPMQMSGLHSEEEMEQADSPVPQGATKPIIPVDRTKTLREQLSGKAKEKGVRKEELILYSQKQFGKNSSIELTASELEQLSAWLESLGPMPIISANPLTKEYLVRAQKRIQELELIEDSVRPV